MNIDDIGPIIQRYQATVDDFDREVARVLGVNDTDLRCLEVLSSAGEAPVTPRDLADALALTTGSVTTMLDRLERLDLLTRTPHPNDGRRVVVDLTDGARSRIWALIGPHIQESTRTVVSGFTAQELDIVARFLTTVSDVQQRHVDALREVTA